MRHDRLVYDVRFSADGRRLLVASGHAHARLWDAATGEPLTLPLKQDDQVVRARFSPDEREIVTAGSDGTARVFVVSRADEPVDDRGLFAQRQVRLKALTKIRIGRPGIAQGQMGAHPQAAQ